MRMQQLVCLTMHASGSVVPTALLEHLRAVLEYPLSERAENQGGITTFYTKLYSSPIIGSIQNQDIM